MRPEPGWRKGDEGQTRGFEVVTGGAAAECPIPIVSPKGKGIWKEALSSTLSAVVHRSFP